MKYWFASLSLLWIALSGCNSSSISLQTLGSMSHATWLGQRPYQVLVVAYAYDADRRIAFENEMTHSLRRAGVSATASHETYPAIQMIHPQSLSAYLNNSNDSAIMFAHAIAVTKQAYNMVDPIDANHSIFRSNHNDWQIKIGAIVETALYVNDVPHSIWLNRMKLQSEADDIAAADSIKAYVNALMTSLRKQTVLSRLQ